jgi:hypothetical protein
MQAYYASIRTAQLALEPEQFLRKDGKQQLVERERVEVTLDRAGPQLRIYTIPHDIPGRKPQPFAEGLFSADTAVKVQTNDKREAKVVSSTLQPSVTFLYRVLGNTFHGILFGGIPTDGNDSDFTQFLASHEVSIQKQDLNEAPAIKVSGRSRTLAIQVWLDDSHQYMPRRVVFDREADTYEWPKHYEYEVDQVQQVNGVAFPLSFVTTSTLSSPRGDRVLTRRVAVASAVLNEPIPKSEFVLRSLIPNGMRVAASDSPLSFMWQDGKVVPSPDSGVLVRANAARFVSGQSSSGIASGWTRFWLIGGNVVLIIALSLVLILRHRKKMAA